MTRNKEQQRSNASTKTQQNNNQSGIVTVNDKNNPTPEERDAQLPKEPGTRRLRSERQSVEEGKRTK